MNTFGFLCVLHKKKNAQSTTLWRLTTPPYSPVCPGGHHCDLGSGKCVAAKENARGNVSAAIKYSDNFGLECYQPSCAVDHKCGPRNDGMVCEAGMYCIEDDGAHHVCKVRWRKHHLTTHPPGASIPTTTGRASLFFWVFLHHTHTHTHMRARARARSH